jgi:sugar phosphate permease
MKKPHYAWVILGVTFVALLSSAAVRATPGVLIVPLEREFGWSRSLISVSISINLLLYGLIGPFAAGLVMRYGARRVVSAAMLLIGLGTLGTVGMHRLWQLIALWGVIVGAGTGIVAIVVGASIVQRWFESHRGLAVGLLTASSATGQLVFLPVLAKIVVMSGWRSAALTMALVSLLVAPLVWWLMRDAPENIGLAPVGSRGSERSATHSSVSPWAAAFDALRGAIRSREFWILGGSFFVCGASTNGLIGTHLIPACMDHGIPEVQAAGLLALMGIFDLIGTTGSGWLSDRLDNRWLLFAYYGLRGLSLLYLPRSLMDSGSGLSVFAVFYGLDWIATVPPTVALARRAFGLERGGIVFGWIVACHQVGAAVAAAVAGYIRTDEGSYDHAFVIAGALCMLSAIAVLFAGRTVSAPCSSSRTSAAVPHRS